VATIIPRWEWRIFGADVAAAEAALAAWSPGPVQESDELYLLSATGANVKVRYDLMDIKLLREVDGDGLERWEPVMKQGFPLRRRCSQGVRGTCGGPVSARAGRLQLGAVPRRAGGAECRRAAGAGPQAARPLPARRLHGRDRQGGGGRPHPADDRGRVGGPVRRHGRRARRRPGRPHQYQLSAGPCRTGVWVVAACGDRRRDELGQVPRRPARPLRELASHRRPGRGDPAGRNLEDAGAISAEPLERTVAAIADMVEEARRHQVRAITAVRHGWPATATRSSRQSTTAPGSRSKRSRVRRRADSPTSRCGPGLA
jgi:exopolyphosphatase/guanosine-5'-triphosphate,3'-diphosphate pyrophosphatase